MIPLRVIAINKQYSVQSVRLMGTYLYTNLFELCCLLIRNAALFVIRMQELKSEVILVRDRQDAWRIFNPLSTSGRFRLLIIIGAFAVGIWIGWFGVFVSHRLLTVGQHEV